MAGYAPIPPPRPFTSTRSALARKKGSHGGFRTIQALPLSEAELKKARALLRSGDYTKAQIAEELQVSRHTLWRAISKEMPV